MPSLEVLRAAVEQQLPAKPPPQMVSTVDALGAQIVALAEKGLKPQAIYDRLRLEDSAFSASYWAVRAMWRKWRRGRGVRAEDVAIPVETAPGEVAQVDFSYVGKLYDAMSGRLRKAWVFVMALAYSRRMVARLCFDQTIDTWLRFHVEALRGHQTRLLTLCGKPSDPDLLITLVLAGLEFLVTEEKRRGVLEGTHHGA